MVIVSPPGSGKSVMIATIAKIFTDNGKRVMFTVHKKELVEQITDTFQHMGVDLSLCTIMTVRKIYNRLKQLPRPHVIITDETHHSKASTYQKIYGYYYDVPRIGFTGTLWRLSGEGFRDTYDQMVEGESVEWLIDNHRLAPYHYYAPTLADFDNLKKSSTGDYLKSAIDDQMTNVFFGDVVKHYQRIANGKKAILYAHSREASQTFAETFCDNGIQSCHIDAKTPKNERERILEGFKDGTIPVLCNVDIVSEGFDVPDCDVVILMRPTLSLVYYLQQSMRCMRYAPNKEAIIIDHVGNYMRHGLPTTPHHWTLNDWKKKSERRSQPVANTVKTCEECFAVVPSDTRVCPHCGFQFPITQKKTETVDMELREIEPAKLNFTTDYTTVAFNSKPNKTFKDYYQYAKAKGYKESWIKFHMPEFRNAHWGYFNKKLKEFKQLEGIN